MSPNERALLILVAQALLTGSFTDTDKKDIALLLRRLGETPLPVWLR